jgi:hypothetical protein
MIVDIDSRAPLVWNGVRNASGRSSETGDDFDAFDKGDIGADPVQLICALASAPRWLRQR